MARSFPVVGFRSELEWVPKGENLSEIDLLGLSFKKTWDSFIQAKSIEDVVFPDIVGSEVRGKLTSQLYDTSNNNVQKRLAAIQELKNHSKSKANIVKFLLLGTEKKFRKVIKKIIKAKPTMSKSTLRKLLSTIRVVCRIIGRQHAYGDGERRMFGDKVIIHSGNPMTGATQKKLKDFWKELHGKKATEPQEDEEPKPLNERTNTDLEREGAPISVGMVYFLIIRNLSEMCGLLGRGVSVDKTVNLALLDLVYAFLMHNGCRPGEIVDVLRHKDLVVPVGLDIESTHTLYWLTFVFLSPKSLGYLMTNDLVKCYIFTLMKGKHMQLPFTRLKTTMPLEYNTVDMFWWYVVTMRIALSLRPADLSEYVIPRRVDKTGAPTKLGKNISRVRGDVNKVIGLTNSTFYSVRYGGTEEDKKCHVKESWTKALMGHTPKSPVTDEYSKNKDTRIVYNNEETKLGIDLAEYSKGMINMSFHPVNCGYKKTMDFVESIEDAEVKAELLEVAKLVDGFVMHKSNKEALLERLAEYDVCDTLKEIPMGDFVSVAPLLPEGVRPLHTKHKELIGAYFKPIEAAVPKVDLVFFPQVRYGDWRNTENLALKKIIVEAPKEVDEPVPPKKTKALAPETLVLTPAPTIKAKPNVADEDMSWDDGWWLDKIEVGNYVVIYPSMQDAYVLDIPGIEEMVWICRISKVRVPKGVKRGADGNPLKVIITGAFFKAKDKKITSSLIYDKRPQTVTIERTSVIWIFKDNCEPADFVLSEEDLDNIKEFINDHPRA
jgi:hypothetical protein